MSKQIFDPGMFEFGSIVLTRFPFTDLTGGKLRPALVISRDNAQRSDLVLAFITSRPHAAQMRDAKAIQPSAVNGLKAPSWVRFDKVATLEIRVIAGKIGDAEPEFLAVSAPIFFGVFGFEHPKQSS
jgi:mRNA interferase MazF